jgi:hypothetical protein
MKFKIILVGRKIKKKTLNTTKAKNDIKIVGYFFYD